MSAATVLRSSAELTPAWVTDVLRSGGVLEDQAVAELATAPVGAGLMGECVRITLIYDGPAPHAPGTVVGKFAAADATARQFMASTGYRNEVCFYRHFAATLPIRTPRCWHAAIDDEGWFTLVLEDLAPAAAGDQLEGCSVAQVEAAVLELVGLHAPRWRDRALEAHPCFARGPVMDADLVAAGLAASLPGFLERYAGALGPDQIDFFERLAVGGANWLRARPAPNTIIHSDYRPDNLLFGTGPGQPAVAVVDWQGMAHGVGTSDVAFCVGNALTVEDRRTHEERLVRAYHDALLAAGVNAYPWDECWRDYRASLLSGLLTTVFGAMYGLRTDRGDRMFELMAQRHATQALDLGADELLTG